MVGSNGDLPQGSHSQDAAKEEGYTQEGLAHTAHVAGYAIPLGYQETTFRLWQGKLDPDAAATYLEKLGITFTVTKVAQWLTTHKFRRTVRKWQARNRADWLTQQCNELQSTWNLDMKKFYAVLRNFQARQPRVCQPHVLSDGTIAATPELQADAQLAYWCKKLNARPSDREQTLSAEDLPSPMPIEEHLRAEALEIVKRDDVYHKLLKTLAQWIATPLTEHM
eukprot:3651075-Amphidinium_carterae.1